MKEWNRIVLPVGIIGVGVAFIALVFGLKSEPVANQDQLKAPAAPQVQVKPALRETVILKTKSNGTVRAQRQIQLVAQVSGTITHRADEFLSGAFFNGNKPLVSIDPRDYEAALLSAEARLVQAERVLAEERGRSRQAQREWRDLGDSASNNLFLRKPQLAEAEAELAAAKAAFTTAQLDLERTQISAPFDGRIQQTHVDVGQYVNVGEAVAEVYDTAIAEIRLPLTDKQISKLNLPLNRNRIQSSIQPDVTLSATVAGKQHQWQGRITRTEASIDVNSRMYYAIAEVEEAFLQKSSAPMLPGLFVNAEIHGKTVTNAIKLPQEALVKRHYIYALNEQNKVEQLQVSVLSKDDQHVWVEVDMPDTQFIVLEKHALLSVGTEVVAVNTHSDDSSQLISATQNTSSTINPALSTGSAN